MTCEESIKTVCRDKLREMIIQKEKLCPSFFLRQTNKLRNKLSCLGRLLNSAMAKKKRKEGARILIDNCTCLLFFFFFSNCKGLEINVE